MTKYLIALLLLVSGAAQAQSSEMIRMYQMQHGLYNGERDMRCNTISGVVMSAAELRGQGQSPESTFMLLHDSYPTFSASWVKHLVNALYFDPAFAHGSNDALADGAYAACLDPEGKASYRPLR
jgi:hypothetical protein